MAVFFCGLVAIMAAMVAADPWFGFFTFTGYIVALRLPMGWWRVLGVAAIAVVTGSSQAGGFPTAVRGAAGTATYAGIVAVNLILAGGMTWFGWVGLRQGERRARLIEELSEANQRLEASLTENAGLYAQLMVQAREAGVLDERQRMAREIHDTLAQGLTGIITQLQAAEQAAACSAQQRRHLDTATRLARDSLTDARRSVDALRPEPLERAPFSEALASVAGKWSAVHGVPVQVTATGPGQQLPPQAEVVLLRVAQEALANVARHAAASRVWVTLSDMGCEVALDVRDDGRGFDPAAVPARAWGDGPRAGGFGLEAMRQRVEGLAGILQVESEPGAGTTISACLPALAGAGPVPAQAGRAGPGAR